MESFNFLKFWRNTAAVRDIDSEIDSVKKFAVSDVVDYVKNPAPDEEEIDNEEDSFFDLVFTENGYHKENNIPKPESPTDVFVKPKPLPNDSNSKPHSPNSVLNSTAPKFRVCFLGFRKSSKPEKVDIPKVHSKMSLPKANESKVEEVPISCISFSLQGTKLQTVDEDSSKQFARADMAAKYLKLMKPLYSRASKRFTEKSKVTEQLSRASQTSSSPSVQSLSSPRNSSEEKQGNRVAVLGAVRKRLAKSRSTASFSTGASPSLINRRDNSLLQEQNDGIQSAILHCKRSYSSARKDCSVLSSRNANEDLPRASCDEQNRWSI
ncbi:putative membrane-associated kinase regulator 2-like [Capsicum annuum]|uniref:probable membrane-associated kinase regulator 2 n=1 Tax=Capsicum annuum TaxID=4072 RepID=UPI0007BFD3F9|nr:probable membrane-associated kinase regulator 2 [Capsicum annuum]KAF3654139.1 putative membrane-associated kinase regulator 2-like [Capsicum annuum]KAF3656210.1 putative membrane-associated kinase regulator 2-like [Capsicum annuum]